MSIPPLPVFELGAGMAKRMATTFQNTTGIVIPVVWINRGITKSTSSIINALVDFRESNRSASLESHEQRRCAFSSYSSFPYLRNRASRIQQSATGKD